MSTTRVQEWATRTEGQETSRQGTILLVILGTIVLLAGVAVLGDRIGSRSVPGLQQEVYKLQQQLTLTGRQDHRQISLLTAEVANLNAKRVVHCGTYDGDVQRAQQLIAEGKDRSAADLLYLDLANTRKPVCVQSGLAAVWYTASLDGLLATPPGSGAGQTPVVTWESIEHTADRFGLGMAQRSSPLTIMVMAYNNHLWGLCRAAFVRAWQDGLVGPGDQTQLTTYYAATTNQGKALVQSGIRAQQRTGYRLLKTASVLSATARLNRGEAEAALVQLLGQSRAQAVRPETQDVVLADLAKHR